MREELKNRCLRCGKCLKECTLLEEIGELPPALAARELTAPEAFGCSLCGLCEAVCPAGLAPWKLFQQRRIQAAIEQEIDLDAWRWLLPDQKKNVMRAYREFYHTQDQKEADFLSAEVVFFPGCTMLTYAPQLTRRVYQLLAEQQGCGGIWTGCCGKPLEQFGLVERKEKMEQKLLAFAREHGIKTLITACPNCYYTMRPMAEAAGIQIKTLYEMLDFPAQALAEKRSCTVHDSCPDRFDGIFARQVRQALAKSGYVLREMTHQGKTTICCGSGGQLSHFRPDRTEQLVQQRLSEAENCGADILAAYCMSCVLKFDAAGAGSIAHVLDLLLPAGESAGEYKGAKARSAAMFAGEAGEKRWNAMLEDEE